MVSPEIKQRIIDELAEEHDPDDLILEICDKAKLNWDQAQALVRTVQDENESVIARRRFPLLFTLALAIFTGGLLLTGYGIYGIFLAFTRAGGMPDDLTTFFLPIIEKGLSPAQALGPAVPLYLKMIIYFVFSPFSAILFGIAMVYGSLAGMQDVWADVLFRKKPGI